MRLRRGLKNFLIFLILTSFTVAQASPIVKKVKRNDLVPFAGWCLNDVAMAKIIADKEQENERCQLRLNMLSDELGAKYELEISMLETRLEAIQAEYLATDQIKTEQIEQLEAAALERPNDYWYLFAASGFVVGAVSVLGIWMLVGK